MKRRATVRVITSFDVTRVGIYRFRRAIRQNNHFGFYIQTHTPPHIFVTPPVAIIERSV